MMWLFSLTIFSYSNFGLLSPSFLFLSDERISQHLCVRCDKKQWRKNHQMTEEEGAELCPSLLSLRVTIVKLWGSPDLDLHPIVYRLCMAEIKVVSTFLASWHHQGVGRGWNVSTLVALYLSHALFADAVVWLVSVKWLGWGSAHAIVRSHYKTVKSSVLFGRKLLVQAKCRAGG